MIRDMTIQTCLTFAVNAAKLYIYSMILTFYLFVLLLLFSVVAILKAFHYCFACRADIYIL